MLLAGATATLVARTFWRLFTSLTNVPYPDHWDMLNEIRGARAGELGWSYLW